MTEHHFTAFHLPKCQCGCPAHGERPCSRCGELFCSAYRAPKPPTVREISEVAWEAIMYWAIGLSCLVGGLFAMLIIYSWLDLPGIAFGAPLAAIGLQLLLAFRARGMAAGNDLFDLLDRRTASRRVQRRLEATVAVETADLDGELRELEDGA